MEIHSVLKFTVYVLYSESHAKIYIGFTSDLAGRLSAHNHASNKGWTSGFQPWKIVYTEEFTQKSEAIRRERELKTSRGRAFIRTTILTHL